MKEYLEINILCLETTPSKIISKVMSGNWPHKYLHATTTKYKHGCATTEATSVELGQADRTPAIVSSGT